MKNTQQRPIWNPVNIYDKTFLQKKRLTLTLGATIMTCISDILKLQYNTCTWHELYTKAGSRAAATSKMEPLVIIDNGLEAVNFYHKVLHLGCCSSPRFTSDYIQEKV